MARKVKNKRAKNTADKESVVEQNINLAVKESVLHTLLSLPIEERFEYLRSLPSHLSSLISQYIPKLKDSDQELTASKLSLTSSYEHLPGINDLTAKLHVLATELMRVNAENRSLKYFTDYMVDHRETNREKEAMGGFSRGRRPAPIQRRMFYLLRKTQRDADRYMDRIEEQLIPRTQWEQYLKDILGEDYVEKERLRRYPPTQPPEPTGPAKSTKPALVGAEGNQSR